jgi:hypothetical protein
MIKGILKIATLICNFFLYDGNLTGTNKTLFLTWYNMISKVLNDRTAFTMNKHEDK